MTKPETVTVKLDKRSYEIIVGEDLLPTAASYIAPLLKRKRAFIVTDAQVATLHLNSLQTSLEKAGIECHAIILPAGESTKSLQHLEDLLNRIFDHKPERKDTLIALGGGVVGDITGFAASILLRGVEFIQIPTTLLAQVDSSVGGKTGVNNHYGKNLIGSFYQPKLVLADMSLLKTLPKRDYLSGYAEVVKYGLINDHDFFEWLNERSAQFSKRDPEALRQAVVKSCQAKASIVAQDEREGNVRALLNLGHTFGHALEKAMGYDGRLLHGEAVAIGMVMAFEFSANQNLCSKEEARAVKTHLSSVGLPTHPNDIFADWNVNDLVDFMHQDKKVSSGKLVFILARGIGKSFICKDVDVNDVTAFLKQFLTQE